MSKSIQFAKFSVLALLGMVLLAGCDKSKYIVLDPKGPVAQQELHLIIISVILCAVVIIPVLGIFVYIAIRYRDKPGNKAPYQPEWADSKVLEIIWWGIPVVIIAILGVFTAKTTLNLTKPPVTDVKPIVVQVTSMDWKWMFTYPDKKIATVNYAEIPAGVPVQFILTSDAPMNSFWIPQLGGQEYTMPGMSMGLWLQADKTGEYFGSGANFTGKGFAHMQFRVKSVSQADFNKWADGVKQTSPVLTNDGYKKLAKPSTEKELSFSSYPKGLFEDIVNKNGGKYYHHMNGMGDGSMSMSMPGMDMGK
ncbi:ubiquinol oxidase subunit II [Neobacillus ginsengisoli]|uniref:Quinol oxidase subunit 2 n=1 Tax=Neobacillus ginsengisoli TaxID=904295 RepID=A0ABT9XWZ4_9BACI|nr:COX aromatic rich motif-containing protein [Neobacillus ginsengisoli]MDQ0200078.1 cytochrome aa3-600 menaquinol oxidase subunit 2 [Neobacillus ginsengisoli]